MPISTGHFRSGRNNSSASARPTATSDGTTSRNSSPEAASASQTHQDRQKDDNAQPRDRAEPRHGSLRRSRQVPGLSHRSIRSVPMKNNTLTRITKQIAA